MHLEPSQAPIVTQLELRVPVVLTTDPPCQLDVLRHDSHPLPVQGAQIGVLEETYEVALSRILQVVHGPFVDSELCGIGTARINMVLAASLQNLPHKSLERLTRNEKFHRLLVFADLAQGDSARTVAPARALAIAASTPSAASTATASWIVVPTRRAVIRTCRS